MVSVENLYFLGGGFGIGMVLGILICLVLGRYGFNLFTRNLKDLSSQALMDNSTRFMALAEKYFTGFAKGAAKDVGIKGDQVIQSVEPVRRAIEKYDAHLGNMERDRDRAFGAIYSQLTEMAKTQYLLKTETGNLVKALRVPHVRGRWGELTLRRAAELSGMAPYCDFTEQAQQSSGKGGQRPDMIVTLPGNRHIIVDAKVPLVAYLDALEAEDDAQQQQLLRDHARQVRAHISNLSSKSYHQGLGSTPEFTVLFIPGESYFSAALAQDPELIEKGIAKGVILSTPTTLIALLKAVAYSWKQQQGYENAEKIRDLGMELYQRLGTLSDHINRLGRDIQKCVTTYNRAVGAVETRVMASARRFESLGISSEKLAPLEEIDDTGARARTLKEQDNHETDV